MHDHELSFPTPNLAAMIDIMLVLFVCAVISIAPAVLLVRDQDMIDPDGPSTLAVDEVPCVVLVGPDDTITLDDERIADVETLVAALGQRSTGGPVLVRPYDGVELKRFFKVRAELQKAGVQYAEGPPYMEGSS